jgi:IS1 family transposase
VLANWVLIKLDQLGSYGQTFTTLPMNTPTSFAYLNVRSSVGIRPPRRTFCLTLFQRLFASTRTTTNLSYIVLAPGKTIENTTFHGKKKHRFGCLDVSRWSRGREQDRWGIVVANHLPLEKRVDVVRHLVEGMSVRGTERLTSVSIPTVLSTILRMGQGCDWLHNAFVRDLDIVELELDEQWSYIAKKQAHVNDNDPVEFGDCYTYIALARTKKLIVSYRVGKRDEADTKAFVADLRARLITIPMLSTDGWQSYQTAVGQSFGGNVDHAVIQKNYKRGSGRGRRDGEFDKYAPADVDFITKYVAHGAPNLDRASTSYVERVNLTNRMHIRRFLRRGNAFSKKIDHHRAAVSLHVAWYNFCRVHESLRVTPAMEAGITDHVWSVQELVERALAAEPCAAPEPKPLAPPAPPAPPPGEKPTTARELPNGKGWLRVVQGGKSAQKDAPKASTPPVAPAAKLVVEEPVVAQESTKATSAPVAKPATASTTTIPAVKLVPRRWEQLDLFGGKVETRARLSWDDDEDCPY